MVDYNLLLKLVLEEKGTLGSFCCDRGLLVAAVHCVIVLKGAVHKALQNTDKTYQILKNYVQFYKLNE